MSVPTQIDRIAAAKTDIKTSITNKGVTVPAETKIDGMSVYIDAIDTAGGVKFASGTITASSKTVTITGLGFTPQHAMLAANSLTSGLLNPIICAFNNKAVYDYSSGLKSVNATFTFTNGGVTVVSGGSGGGYNFVGDYTWIAWAE